MVDHLVPTPVVDIFNVNPALEAGTKWFDRFDRLRVRLRLTRSPALMPSKGKLTILSKVEGPMGFPKGRSGSSPL